MFLHHNKESNLIINIGQPLFSIWPIGYFFFLYSRQDQQVSQTQLDKHQRNLQSLKASQGNRLKRFGPFMPQLIQTVEEYARLGKFHKKPIGPLGIVMKESLSVLKALFKVVLKTFKKRGQFMVLNWLIHPHQHSVFFLSLWLSKSSLFFQLVCILGKVDVCACL